MKKMMFAIALCATLVACKQEAAPNAQAPAASGDAAVAATAAAPAATGLPVECENYINRVKACVSKSGGAAAAAQFQQALDQSKAQWEAATDKAGLIPSCKAANDQFAQMATMLKCE